MTKAYADYHQTVMTETTALISKLQGLLRGDQSVTAEEINWQADQCFDRLDSAAAKYWADFAAEQHKQTKQSPEYQRGGKPCQIEPKKFG